MLPPVIMVHGAFCGGWAMEDLASPFEAAGHEVLRPDLRGHGPNDPPQAVGGLSMADYVQDVARLCAAQAEPPILIGHSLGGLIAILAASRTPVTALAVLAPSAPWGVAVASLEEAVTAFGVQMMGPFWMGAVPPDAGLMELYGLGRAEQTVREAAIKRLRHESARALGQTLNWWMDPFMTTSIGPGPLKVPSLALVGESDRIHAPASVRRTAQRIGAACEVLPGMGHWLPQEPRAGEIAGRILDWLGEVAAPWAEAAE
jgi:pimeloyl-ACP methyl ester carboxylesterase